MTNKEVELIYEKILNLGIKKENLIKGEPMKNHTSFRIGGPADIFIVCENEKELSRILSFVQNENIKHLLIGNGSNLLFKDSGYDGIIIKLAGDFEKIEKRGEDEIYAGSAALLSKVSNFASINSLSGMEFASGIPGSLGGAIFMNAGAYGGEMKDVICEVNIMSKDGKNIRKVSGEDMGFSYRHSAIEDSEDIVISALLNLIPSEANIIKSKVDELGERRRSKQPTNLPSAGSFFKRPKNGYAAALIEEAGLKGYSVGGASVSEKHSGFVVNNGGASYYDVIELMNHVQEEVNKKFGIMLEPEVRIID